MTPTSHLSNCWTKDFPECLIGWYWAWRRRKLLWHQSSTSWFSLLSNWGPVEKKGAQHARWLLCGLSPLLCAQCYCAGCVSWHYTRANSTLAEFTLSVNISTVHTRRLFGAEPPIVECHQSVTRSSQHAARALRHTHNNYFKTYYAYASFSVLVSRYLGHWETLFYRLIPITSKKSNVILDRGVNRKDAKHLVLCETLCLDNIAGCA